MHRLRIPTRKDVSRAGIRLLQILYRHRPAPLRPIFLLRELTNCEDSLFPETLPFIATSKELHNPFLKEKLVGFEFGRWSLGVKSLALVEGKLRKVKPQGVVEFGSGLSTICLAQYMQELYGDENQIRVISIDQGLPYIEETMRLLESLGLNKLVLFIHAPLRRQVIEGHETICYGLEKQGLESSFKNLRPTFVLVDGPAAEFGARFGTLPLVYPFLGKECHFLLDDALRDGELWIAQQWLRLPYLRLEGIYLKEKGLLAGRTVSSPSQPCVRDIN